MARAQAPKGWRFAGEMREIAAAFDDAGVPADFFAAGAEVADRLRSFKDATDVDPHQVFDAVRVDEPEE